MLPTTAARPRSSARTRRVPPHRVHARPRRRTAGRPVGSPSEPGWLARGLEHRSERKRERRARRSYQALRRETLGLVTSAEVEQLACESGFYRRRPREIRGFEFALCCALAAVVEGT
jgi:hypothetical protein